MSIKRRRVSEMLKRVDQFGSTHTDAFPPRSTGRRLFSALQRALAELTTQQVAHISRHSQAGKSAADDAREKLLTRLRALCRTARSLAVGAPVADVTFRLPRRGGDHALIAAARQMTDAARPS